MISPLVIGGRGLIGSAVVERFQALGISYIYTCRDRRSPSSPQALFLDLLEPGITLPKLAGGGPRAVYLIAGVPGVLRCEGNPDAWRVNADAPAMLAGQAARRGWEIVFLSTGAVEIAPHTAYARQKAHVEAVVLALGGAIVRPRGRVTPRNVAEFAEVLIGACGQPGVHWWGGE